MRGGRTGVRASHTAAFATPHSGQPPGWFDRAIAADADGTVVPSVDGPTGLLHRAVGPIGGSVPLVGSLIAHVPQPAWLEGYGLCAGAALDPGG